MENKKFYICRDCDYKFYEINEDKECPNCKSRNIDLHRIFKSDNAGEIEKVEHLNREKLEEELTYINCLNPDCNKKIHADEIRPSNKDYTIICPHCDTKMSFILEGPLNNMKLIKIIK